MQLQYDPLCNTLKIKRELGTYVCMGHCLSGALIRVQGQISALQLRAPTPYAHFREYSQPHVNPTFLLQSFPLRNGVECTGVRFMCYRLYL